jgi:hypothetical protein
VARSKVLPEIVTMSTITSTIPTTPAVFAPSGLHRITVYTVPEPSGYRSRVDFKPGQALPVVIDGQPLGEISVDSILPSPRPHGGGG